MAKRVKFETTVLVGVLAALVAGGIVGLIGSASNGFDKDILEEWTQPKEDYVKINCSNKYENKILTTDGALEFLNYDNKVFDEVSVAASCSLDNNAFIISEDGMLKASFDNEGYNRIKVTTGTNYTELYETNKNGDPKEDIFGNKIIESIISDESTLSVNGLDSITLEASDDESYPIVESYTFKFDENQTELLLECYGGSARITSIELWNVELD